VRDGAWRGPTAVHVPRAYTILNLGLFLGLSYTVFKEIQLSPKTSLLPSQTLSQILDLEKIFHSMSTVTECDRLSAYDSI